MVISWNCHIYCGTIWLPCVFKKESVKIRRVYGLERACKVQKNRIERLERVYEIQNYLDRTRLYCHKLANLTFWKRLERVYEVYKCV